MPSRVLSTGFAPVDDDAPARLRRLHAGDDLDQRRFSGAVFPDQAMHLPRLQHEIDILQRGDAAKALRDAGEFEKGSQDNL